MLASQSGSRLVCGLRERLEGTLNSRYERTIAVRARPSARPWRRRRSRRGGVLEETVPTAEAESIEAITARAIREGMDRRATRPHGANRRTLAERIADRGNSDAFPASDHPVRGPKQKRQQVEDVAKVMAPRAGLEPATRRLTVACSTN